MSFTPAEEESLSHTPHLCPLFVGEDISYHRNIFKGFISYLWDLHLFIDNFFLKFGVKKKVISRTYNKNHLIQFGVKRKVISKTYENYPKLCPA